MMTLEFHNASYMITEGQGISCDPCQERGVYVWIFFALNTNDAFEEF